MGTLSVSKPETIYIGRMVGSSFERDKADFTAFSTRFADPFGADYRALNEEIAALPNIKGSNSELKMITKRLKENLHLFLFDMDKLDSLITLSLENLTIARNDFGIRQVRRAVTDGKVPEMEIAVNNLLKNVNANLKPLKAIGLTDAFLKNLEARVKVVTNDALLKHTIIGNRGQIVLNNTTRFEEFKKLLKFILITGKALYKTTNPPKSRDYTIAFLRRKHRASQAPVPEPAM